MRQKRIFFVGVLLVLLGGMIFVAFARHHSSRPGFLLDERKAAAYSNIVELARSLQNPDAQIPNSATLARLFRDPMEAPASAYAIEKSTDSMMVSPAMKNLAQAIVTKGEEAEAKGRFAEAAERYLSVLELGVNYEHGPVIYFFYGAAFERLGILHLKTVLPKLSNDEILSLAQRIQSVSRMRISFRELARRENYYVENLARDVFFLMRARFDPERRKIVANSRVTLKVLSAHCEGVAAAAAAFVYERQNGTAVTNVDGIVPKLLPQTPFDEFAGRPMRLLVLPKSSVFYSVGANGEDEKGLGDDIVFSFVDAIEANTQTAK